MAARHLADFLAPHSLERMKLLYALFRYGTVFLAKGYVHALAQCAAMHAPHGYTAYIAAEIEARDEHLGVSLKLCRRGNL